MNMEADENTIKQPFREWAIVELFGHQRVFGEVTEAEIAGGKLLRVDVMLPDGKTCTRFFGTGAIYSLNPASEEAVRKAAGQYYGTGISRYQLQEDSGDDEDMEEPSHGDEE